MLIGNISLICNNLWNFSDYIRYLDVFLEAKTISLHGFKIGFFFPLFTSSLSFRGKQFKRYIELFWVTSLNQNWNVATVQVQLVKDFLNILIIYFKENKWLSTNPEKKKSSIRSAEFSFTWKHRSHVDTWTRRQVIGDFFILTNFIQSISYLQAN